MTKLGSIIEVIKEIECPVDQIEDKLRNAYKEYVGDNSEILLERKPDLDKDGLKGYEIYTGEEKCKSLYVLVREGEEHYVSNVEDVYIDQ